MIINYSIYNGNSVPILKTSLLIAGDSHPQQSVNPKYFKNAQNISQYAEPYVLTYWKLKNIFKSHKPDTLIIGFAPHNISQFNDYKFSNRTWASEMFRRSYSIQEFEKISNMIPIDYLLYYKTLWKQTAYYPKKNHINFIGNYSNNNQSNITNWKLSLDRHYYHNGIKLGVSELSLNYLDSIVNLANSTNTKLILINNPVYTKYLENIPSQIMKKFDELNKKYKVNHMVFDKTRDTYPDSLLFDSDHLNKLGEQKFIKELKHFIQTEKNAQ